MVFKKFFETFDLTMVHDATLQVERGLDNARVFRTSYQVDKKTRYPVMLFQRSPIKRSGEFGQVGIHRPVIGNKSESFDWEQFHGIWGTIVYKFLMVFKDQRQAEQFEVSYAADRHIKQLKKFTCSYDIGASALIGPLNYELLWEDLSEYGYGQTEMGFITLGGTFKCNGEQIVFLEQRQKGIKWVHVRGYTYNNSELFHFVLDLTKGEEA
jgi:hypothetical protein